MQGMWAGKNIVRTVNGNGADADGNIKPEDTGCLPLTGGTMTGTIVNTGSSSITIRRDTDDSYLAFFGGSTISTGATLSLSGKDRENAGGFFQLVSKDGEGNEYTFVGRPNGNLTWSGKHIVRSVNGVYAGTDGNVSTVIANITNNVKAEYNTSGSFTIPSGGTWAYHCGTNYRGWGVGSSDGAHWGGTCAGGTTIGVDSRGTACFAIRIS